jgi:CheY-like chemotaxis protein
MAMSVLIVDDNTSFLGAATMLLEREGLTVAGVAATSREALRKIEDLRPNVILVDVFLGEESGLELAQRLVEDGRGEGATVILISTHAEDDLADLIAARRVAGFLQKAELSARAVRRIVDEQAR